MRLKINGKEIPRNKPLHVKVNGKSVTLEKVIANGTTVWQYEGTGGGNPGGGGHWQNIGGPFQNNGDATGASGAGGIGTTFCSPNPDGVSWTCQVRVWVPNDVPNEPDEVDIDIDDIILKDSIEDTD